MFAAANIRNQNPLQNETSLLLLLENVTFSPVSFFERFKQRLCIAVSHSYWY